MINFRKIYRLVFLDNAFKIRFVLIVLLAIGVFWAWKYASIERARIRQLETQKSLVQQISSLEAQLAKKIDEKAGKKAGAKTIAEHQLRLQGIMADGDSYVALINGQIKTAGQKLDTYTVISVTKDSVVLEDPATKAMKTLALPKEQFLK